MVWFSGVVSLLFRDTAADPWGCAELSGMHLVDNDYVDPSGKADYRNVAIEFWLSNSLEIVYEHVEVDGRLV